MAIAGGAVWEVQPSSGIGNDVNGGGFVTGASGSDYSQAARRVATGTDDSTTDGVANGTTTFTSATANFGTTIVGNIIYLQGGTGSLAITRRQVTARASTTSITVDASVAAGTGITMNIGGPLASPGEAGRNSLAGNIVHIKSGPTYSVTSTTGNVSGGLFNKNSINVSIIGYQTTRYDYGTPPLIQASGISTFALITTGAAGTFVGNLVVDGATLSGSRAISLSGGVIGYKLKVLNCLNSGLSGTGASLIDCEATGCTTTGSALAALNLIGCYAHDNSINGISVAAYAVGCISESNSGATSDGFIYSSALTMCQNCTAYNNGRDGFRTNGLSQQAINCIAEGNGTSGTGTGFNNPSDFNSNMFINCAAFDNVTADFDVGTGLNDLNVNPVTGTSTFFTDAPNGDFSLNNTAGGGADARGAGFPGTYPGGLTVSIQDIGAAQSSSSSSGGGEHSAVF